MSYDIFISSGGPGSPLESRYTEWDESYFRWLSEVERWNNNPANEQKKYVLFICHSFQLACRHYNVGIVCKRRSTAFGVFPVHMLNDGLDEPVFAGQRRFAGRRSHIVEAIGRDRQEPADNYVTFDPATLTRVEQYKLLTGAVIPRPIDFSLSR